MVPFWRVVEVSAESAQVHVKVPWPCVVRRITCVKGGLLAAYSEGLIVVEPSDVSYPHVLETYFAATPAPGVVLLCKPHKNGGIRGFLHLTRSTPPSAPDRTFRDPGGLS